METPLNCYSRLPEKILAMTLIKIYWRLCIMVFILLLIWDAGVLVLLFNNRYAMSCSCDAIVQYEYCFRWIIQLAMYNDEPRWHGIVYFFILMFAITIRRIAYSHQEYITIKIGVQIKSSMSAFILKKVRNLLLPEI